MKIALLFGIFPKANLPDILSDSRGVVQQAADTLQKSIIDGLGSLNADAEIINLPFLGSYPKRYKRMFSPSNAFKITTDNGKGREISGQNISYCNITLFKYFFIRNAAQKALSAWAQKNRNEKKIVIVYSIFIPFLTAAFDVRRKYENVKVLCIAPDLPQYMSAGGNSILRQYLKKRSTATLDKMYDAIDGFVILSKYMAKPLRIGNKPSTVIEGIYNPNCESVNEDDLDIDSPKIVFYAGTLAKRYGIMRLVRAFHSLSRSDAKLVICGNGDAMDEIKSIASMDNRIEIKGNVPHNKVIRLIHKASVLVNPRIFEGEFTKYSFPSKTMEYLASGTPTILYRLQGIPDEYYDYCITLENLSIDSLAQAIDDVLSMSKAQRDKIGAEARTFILSKKNPKAQVSKIISVIEQLY